MIAVRRAGGTLREQGDSEAAEAIDRLFRAATSAVPALDYYTATEARNMLRMTGQTIKSGLAQGRLPGYRIGSRIAIPQAAVEDYVRRAGASLDLDDLADEEAAALVAEGWPMPWGGEA